MISEYMVSLEKYISHSVDIPEDSIYYNENFCNATLEYLGSTGEFSEEDIKYLNSKGYDKEDFMDEDDYE